MRRNVYFGLVALVAVVATVGTLLVHAAGRSDAAQGANWSAEPSSSPWAPIDQLSPLPIPSPSVSPTPAKLSVVYPTLRAPKSPAKVRVSGAHLFGWTLVTRGGSVLSPSAAANPAEAPGASAFSKPTFTGSANMDSTRNTVESMIKGYIAADWLRRTDAAGKTPTKNQLNQITLMIIDSNNQIAQEYYNLGGHDSVIKRMISVCGLRDTVKIKHDSWSFTELTPADAARYGECLADGRAAGPKWTTWLLHVMTQVRGGVKDQKSDTVEGGRWGIVDGLPKSMQGTVSMKNGWTLYVDGWHVNCLGIGPGWVLSVMVRTASLQSGADACASVARQLVVTD